MGLLIFRMEPANFILNMTSVLRDMVSWHGRDGLMVGLDNLRGPFPTLMILQFSVLI